MNKLCLSALLLMSLSFTAKAQEDELSEDSSWKKEYRSFATKENDLVHTKLVANFNYEQSQMNGEVWLQLHPHFYATNTLQLDAKAMEIKDVAIVQNNSNKINISYNHPTKAIFFVTQFDYIKNSKLNDIFNYTNNIEKNNK
jgi:aminopeptidase N